MRSGWLVALSVLISAGAMAVYSQFLRVAAVRNNPEGYVAAFAIAAVIAGLAVALARRWYAWAGLVLSLVLLLGGATFNFVLARIPAVHTTLRVGERPADFTLADAAGRPVSLADYRGKKPVVIVFYRGYW
jgi:cytochrome oxidase Cu insertion factor (SCO1/SenC/PrrC family)